MRLQQGVCLPLALVQRIDAEIEGTGLYRSRAEFVRDACRRELERIQRLKKGDKSHD